MFFRKFRRAPSPKTGGGSPSPLLTHLAGDFAAQVAALWPDPHAPFIGAPAPRRHLVALALARGRPEAAAAVLAGGALKTAIRLAEPAAPPGLARALERLGEPCWSAEDYQALLRVLASRAGGKPLRHAQAITPAQVRVLDRLPTPLLDQGLGGRVKTDVAAALIAEAWRAIASRDGEAVAGALPARWGAADGPKALAELIVDDLEPAVAPPPFPGSERLRPLADKSALIDAAKRYRNCLRRELRWAGQGVSAYYEWIEAPGAVVEITNDRLYGWSLEQARTVGNDPVPEPIRAGIIAELRAWGVRVGRPVWWLINDLREAAENPRAIIDDEAKVIAELFGD